MNGRSLFSVQLFTFLFVLYIKVFYICNHYNFIGMKQTAVNIWRFYLEGFRSMTLGRTLWLIILVKLFIMFFILRLFFFPRFLPPWWAMTRKAMSVMSLSIGVWATKHGDTEFISLPL